MSTLRQALAIAGVWTVAAIAVVIDQRDTSSNTVADPPLSRERAGVLPSDVGQDKPDLYPFNERELCRAALATRNGRDPSAYRVASYGKEGTWFWFVRPDDDKRFHYGCRIELGEVRIEDDGRWNENTRYYYTLFADRVQIEYWSKPNDKERANMRRLGMETRDELLERQTFTKNQLADR